MSPNLRISTKLKCQQHHRLVDEQSEAPLFSEVLQDDDVSQPRGPEVHVCSAEVKFDGPDPSTELYRRMARDCMTHPQTSFNNSQSFLIAVYELRCCRLEGGLRLACEWTCRQKKRGRRDSRSVRPVHLFSPFDCIVADGDVLLETPTTHVRSATPFSPRPGHLGDFSVVTAKGVPPLITAINVYYHCGQSVCTRGGPLPLSTTALGQIAQIYKTASDTAFRCDQHPQLNTSSINPTPRPSVRSTAQATWCQVDPQASDDLVIASDAVLWVPMRENGVGTSPLKEGTQCADFEAVPLHYPAWVPWGVRMRPRRRDEKFPPAVGVQIRFQTRQDENTRPRDTLTIKGNPSQLNFCTVARVTYNCYHYHCEPRNQSKCDLPPDQPPRLPPPQIPCCLTSSARGCRVVPIKTAVVAPCIGDLAD
ncbi:unnamed protein product [Mesocestoides corti]|uniref:Uncharacterized protein n=1 Tax=Mesocestoides corti TaxID=53468 RepID=A0A158QUT0_MESCO|nr:unnamed protein product [Mesocestoides corti]